MQLISRKKELQRVSRELRYLIGYSTTHPLEVDYEIVNRLIFRELELQRMPRYQFLVKKNQL